MIIDDSKLTLTEEQKKAQAAILSVVRKVLNADKSRPPGRQPIMRLSRPGRGAGFTRKDPYSEKATVHSKMRRKMANASRKKNRK